MSGGGRGSGNRKYVQLTIDDVERLLSVFNDCRDNSPIDRRIGYAIAELIDKAQSTPNPRICLAHAVARGVK